jgi:2,5-diamino-6-(ribosylamino)-4(3H)-pyrimidinone 5'-phosphate reductase
MAMSLDGKISTYRREDIVMGSEHDRRLMDVLRSKTDAVIIGAGTLRCDGLPILTRFEDLKAKRLRRGLSPHPINVVLSRELRLPVSKPFFTRTDTEKIVFTTRSAPAGRVKRFRRTAEVIVLPGRKLSPRDVLSVLRDRDIKSVLLEGGGEIHFAFAKEGVVDEIYITLTPKLFGGTTAPSVMDGKGFSAADHPALRLVSSKRIGDELYLRYRVIHR